MKQCKRGHTERDARGRCKACTRQRARDARITNPPTEAQRASLRDRQRAKRKLYKPTRDAWRAANREQIKAYEAAYHDEHRASHNAAASIRAFDHYRRNRSRYIANARARQTALAIQTPLWADPLAIEAIYASADRLTACLQTPFEVDHEVPIKGVRVRGLHVSWNLRAVPRAMNRRKKNRFAA